MVAFEFSRENHSLGSLEVLGGITRWIFTCSDKPFEWQGINRIARFQVALVMFQYQQAI
jgi:hypothetical protein